MNHLPNLLQSHFRPPLKAKQSLTVPLHGLKMSRFFSSFQLSYSVESQKCSSKQMMKQLEEVCRSHNETPHKLAEGEKRNKAFIHKSNYLTTLLEQDREKFVHQIHDLAKTIFLFYRSRKTSSLYLSYAFRKPWLSPSRFWSSVD